MEETIMQSIKQAGTELIGMMDFRFLILFVILVWLTMAGVRSILTKYKVYKKWFITLFVFLLGVIFAVLYHLYWPGNGKVGLPGLFISFLAGMIVYKIGIDTVLEGVEQIIKARWAKLIEKLKIATKP